MNTNISLNDYIRLFDLEIDESIITLVKQNDSMMNRALTGNGQDSSVRDCYEYYYHPHAYDHFSPSDQKIYDYFNKLTTELVDSYKELFSETKDSIVNAHAGFHILKYGIGGKYKQHVDDFGRMAFRRLSMSIVLSDEYEGGKFSFFDNQYQIDVKKNQAIVFPSTWLFPHQITPITSGERWALVSWFI
jgi:hypothetical protein